MLTNAYCTLEEIKTAKEIQDDNAPDDLYIENCITAASRFIDGETHRRFWKDTVDQIRTYRAPNGQRIYIDDLVSITTLKTDEDGDRVYEITWAATDYDLMPENASNDGIPYTWAQVTPNGNNWFPTYQPKGVQITGKFGFPSIPAEIKEACRLIATRAYQNRYGQNVDGPATITGAGVVIKPSDVPKLARDMISHWVRVS